MVVVRVAVQVVVRVAVQVAVAVVVVEEEVVAVAVGGVGEWGVMVARKTTWVELQHSPLSCTIRNPAGYMGPGKLVENSGWSTKSSPTPVTATNSGRVR